MNKERKEDIAAIKELLNQFVTSTNTGDFDLWMSLWADDGIQMPPNARSKKGKEQIREVSKSTFENMKMDIAIKSIEELEVHGDIGLVRGEYSLRLTPKAGGETIDAMPDGKVLTILRKQSDGSWKIAYDCFNSNLPPT
ncbi:MAG: YybH family protein [Candidatus Thorarchaeota archaeon]|jgi:uncharacterized protein (TIGR02246 family)